MTQDVKIIGFINCYLFYFLVTGYPAKVNRRLLYCVDIKVNVFEKVSNRLTYLVFNDLKLKLNPSFEASHRLWTGIIGEFT